VDLVYHPSVHKATSKHDYNLPPDEVIPESNSTDFDIQMPSSKRKIKNPSKRNKSKHKSRQ